jgi:hypothetical protein
MRVEQSGLHTFVNNCLKLTAATLIEFGNFMQMFRLKVTQLQRTQPSVLLMQELDINIAGNKSVQPILYPTAFIYLPLDMI